MKANFDLLKLSMCQVEKFMICGLPIPCTFPVQGIDDLVVFDCISIFLSKSQPFLTFHFSFVNCQKIGRKSGNRLHIPRVEGRKRYPAWCKDGDLFQTEVGSSSWKLFFLFFRRKKTYLATWGFQTPVQFQFL